LQKIVVFRWRGRAVLARMLRNRCRCRRRRIEIELGMRYVHHPPIEPTHDIFKTFNAMPRLARPQEFVRLAWKDNHGRWAFHVFERPEQLPPESCGLRKSDSPSTNSTGVWMSFTKVIAERLL